jgi:hypothetical protein
MRTVGIPLDIRKYYYCKYLVGSLVDIITIQKSVDGFYEKRDYGWENYESNTGIELFVDGGLAQI